MATDKQKAIFENLINFENEMVPNDLNSRGDARAMEEYGYIALLRKKIYPALKERI